MSKQCLIYFVFPYYRHPDGYKVCKGSCLPNSKPDFSKYLMNNGEWITTRMNGYLFRKSERHVIQFLKKVTKLKLYKIPKHGKHKVLYKYFVPGTMYVAYYEDNNV